MRFDRDSERLLSVTCFKQIDGVEKVITELKKLKKLRRKVRRGLPGFNE